MAKEKAKETIWGYVSAISIILGIHIFLYQPFRIPSGSMIPTLLVGDYIFVSKFAYGYSRYSVFLQPQFIKKRLEISQPKRGDVAVFFHKFYEGEDANFYDHGVLGGFFSRQWRRIRNFLGIPLTGVNYVKRVIGMPGDKIQMKEGRLYINDQIVELTPDGEYPMEESGNLYITKKFIETLPNGKKHDIIKIFPFGQAHLDNTEEFTVPQDCYFMMGDNRDNSCDSREIKKVGFIHKKFLVGRPEIVFFSTKAKWYEIHKWLFDLRYDRILKLIK